MSEWKSAEGDKCDRLISKYFSFYHNNQIINVHEIITHG